MNNTDTEMLVEKAKNGDMSAIDELYRAYYDPVLKFVIKIGLNEYDAQDIVSDSFMEVMNHIGQLRDNSSFSSWLYTIAKRKALEFLKKESRHQRVYFDTDNNGDNDLSGIDPDLAAVELAYEDAYGDTVMLPADYVENEDVKRIIAEQIDSLSPEHKEVLFLFYYKNKSIAEIAQLTDTNQNNVKARLFHARKNLKTKLEDLRKKGFVLCAAPFFQFIPHYGKLLGGSIGASVSVSGTSGTQAAVTGANAASSGVSGISGAQAAVTGANAASSGVSGISGAQAAVTGANAASSGVSGISGAQAAVTGANATSSGVSGMAGVATATAGKAAAGGVSIKAVAIIIAAVIAVGVGAGITAAVINSNITADNTDSSSSDTITEPVVNDSEADDEPVGNDSEADDEPVVNDSELDETVSENEKTEPNPEDMLEGWKKTYNDYIRKLNYDRDTDGKYIKKEGYIHYYYFIDVNGDNVPEMLDYWEDDTKEDRMNYVGTFRMEIYNGSDYTGLVFGQRFIATSKSNLRDIEISYTGTTPVVSVQYVFTRVFENKSCTEDFFDISNSSDPKKIYSATVNYEGDKKTRIFPYNSDKEHDKFDEASYNEYKKELFGSSDIKTISLQNLEGAMTADEALNYLLEN